MVLEEIQNQETKQHKLNLSDLVWAHAQRRATLEGFDSTSALCEYLMRHYLDTVDRGQQPPIYEIPDVERPLRSVYVTDDTWGGMQVRKVLEGRPIGDIVEQLLRAYLGFELGDEIID